MISSSASLPLSILRSMVEQYSKTLLSSSQLYFYCEPVLELFIVGTIAPTLEALEEVYGKLHDHKNS